MPIARCALLLSLFCASCGRPAAKPFKFTELVMQPGMVVTADTNAGTISISATDVLTRAYTWEGATRSVTLEPRTERWHGSLGAYYPGPGDHWQEHHGITRGVLQEGRQHFASKDEAVAWLQKQSGYYPTVYRDDGLVVSFGKTLERRQINVEVWQIYVAGSTPSGLPGGQNDKVRVSTVHANET